MNNVRVTKNEKKIAKSLSCETENTGKETSLCQKTSSSHLTY